MGNKGRIVACVSCGRKRPDASRGLCSTCYHKQRRKLGTCANCRKRKLLYAKGECKPCRDAAYRGFR